MNSNISGGYDDVSGEVWELTNKLMGVARGNSVLVTLMSGVYLAVNTLQEVEGPHREKMTQLAISVFFGLLDGVTNESN